MDITKSVATIARYFFNPAMISAVNFEDKDVVDGEDDDDDEDYEDADQSEDERFNDFEELLIRYQKI